jgi:tRNA(Ile2) C34 agmatinyltransferase TiaS
MSEKSLKQTYTGYTKMSRKMGDYDRWFQPCTKCGYDTGKAGKKPGNRCWKCGNYLRRDYSDRALKPSVRFKT